MENTTEGRNPPPNFSQEHASKQPSATEETSAGKRNEAGSKSEDPIRPDEVPLHPSPELTPVLIEITPPHVPMGEPSKIASQEEDPSNIDSDQGGFSDEYASESSSPHATPLKTSSGRKSKKKHREEKSFRDVAKGSQKTLPNMISTRSKQGQPSKGASPSKKL